MGPWSYEIWVVAQFDWAKCDNPNFIGPDRDKCSGALTISEDEQDEFLVIFLEVPRYAIAADQHPSVIASNPGNGGRNRRSRLELGRNYRIAGTEVVADLCL